MTFERFDADELSQMAVEFQRSGRSRESLAMFKQAAEKYLAANDLVGAGRCLNGVGALYKDLGEISKSAAFLERALVLRRQTGDLRGEAITLTTLGPVYQCVGKLELADQFLLEALRITRGLSDRGREGQVLYNLAELHIAREQLGQAHVYLRDALDAAKEVGDEIEVWKCLNALGLLHNHLGEKEEAFSHIYQCLRLAEQLRNVRALSCAYHNLGMIYHGTDEEERGWPFLERSVEIDMQSGAQAEAAKTMTGLANAIFFSAPEQARQYAHRALHIAQKTGNQNLVAMALCSVANVMTEPKDSDGALRAIKEAQELSLATGDISLQAQALCLMGATLDQAGEHLAAFTSFEEAVALLESSYEELQDDSFRISYHSSFSIQNIYLIYTSRLVQYAMASGNSDYANMAFHVCERRRNRVLKEYLHRRYEQQPTKSRISDRFELGPLHPALVEDIRRQVCDAETALLEYSLHREVSYVWVLTEQGQHVIQLSEGGNALRKRVSQLRQAAILDSWEYPSLAHELYELVIGPVQHWIAGKRNLLIVPDNALYLLPFQLLLTEPPGSSAQDGNHSYLVRNHAITYASSSAIFGWLAARGGRRCVGGNELVAFAPVDFPPEDSHRRKMNSLPGSLHEIERLLGLFGPDSAIALTHAAATKEAAVSGAIRNTRFVHFATHGWFDDYDPGESGIMLRGGGLLRRDDIMALEIDADLVTLSACESALGTLKAGEGILGLTRSFFCAGARSVCASLWPVDDQATADLMGSFYKNLLQGMKKAESLQAAQLEFIGGRWSAPKYWAPFTLSGMWK